MVHLDALRGIAAFSVLLNHWRVLFFVEQSRIAKPSLLTHVFYLISSLGHQWVMVFFVLSGYLVGGSVLRAVSEDRWSWREYLLARLTRLYIVLLPALVLCGALDWMGMHAAGAAQIYGGQSGIASLQFDMRTTLNLHTFLGNAAFLQGIALPGMGGDKVHVFASDLPLWSLSYEFWYYIGFPIAVLALASAKSRRVRLIYGLALLGWGWFVGLRILVCAVPWMLGVAIYCLPRLPALGPWMRRAACGLAVAALALSLWVAGTNSSLSSDALVAESAAILIWVTLGCAKSAAPAWYAGPAQRAARSSYTLYLVHLPMLMFLKAWLHLPLFVPGARSLLPALALLWALIYAQLLYELFEKRTDALRGWIKQHGLGATWIAAQPGRARSAMAARAKASALPVSAGGASI
jgi:peptidoglycan/LPS O-acetylase OafA/YrhL